MAKTAVMDMTEHQLRSEIGNLERRKKELDQRINDMEIALLVKRHGFKPDDVVEDKNGRRGVVRATSSDFLRVQLFNSDGKLGWRNAVMYSQGDWTLVEAQQGREDT